MLYVKKLTIQRFALQKLCPGPPQNNPNLTIHFAPFLPPPPLPPSSPPTALPRLPTNFIEDTSILLVIDYTN